MKITLSKEACDKFYQALVPAAQRIIKERKSEQKYVSKKEPVHP